MNIRDDYEIYVEQKVGDVVVGTRYCYPEEDYFYTQKMGNLQETSPVSEEDVLVDHMKAIQQLKAYRDEP